ncbi:MalM family protein [Pseudomonas sp.]|uniref:MalM family protein n=1 Tax=Pseudomonas sp. TaxID=306 RepID=UPI002734A508|nr:MalM family protein [Pseudomonas sp.]MDP2745951.1 MalM family protein [Pseudomonas sp.]
MRIVLMLIGFLVAAQASASGRYLTWVDDQGRVHNSFVDNRYTAHQRAAAGNIQRSDQARLNEGEAAVWPGSKSSGESKRRYFTWVDASGNLQNSFYAGQQVQAGGNEILLGTGERSSAYISSDVLEGRDFARDEQDGRYFTWVDEQGRMRNSKVPAKGATPPTPTLHNVPLTQGREITFDAKPQALPGLDGQPTAAMQALLAGTEAKSGGRYQELVERCCGQLAEGDFTPLSADEPRYEELNRFSPSLDFPMGKSYYAALKLPRSQYDFGLRIRSFANKQVAYPSLLFLDQAKQPTRLVSDAVYRLHAETWYRYAFIEGTVPVRAAAGEHYVLLLTTDEDRSLQTLDNKPFKRPLQALALDEAGMQSHAHSDEGAFELAIVR